MNNRRIKVAAYTGGKSIPSARFRVRQFISHLQRFGIEMREFTPLVSSFPPSQLWLRPAWALTALCVRTPAVLASHFYEISFLQRELISTCYSIEPLLKHPLVFDVDDAIFLHKRGWNVNRIASKADLVICGNDYLANHFSSWNKNIEIIPTAVDTSRFTPRIGKKPGRTIIGWIGTSSNFKYLYKIESALNNVLKLYPDIYLRIISDRAPEFQTLLEEQVQYIPWSPEIEVNGIQEMTVGIMPLEDSAWARGKCSYKMLQYMACGIPVVVSPIGMNSQLLSMGEVGLGARNNMEWENSLIELLTCPNKREHMGKNGIKIVNNHFSIDNVVSLLANCLKKIVQ